MIHVQLQSVSQRLRSLSQAAIAALKQGITPTKTSQVPSSSQASSSQASASQASASQASASQASASPSGSSQPPSVFRLKLITQFYPPDFAASGQFMDELAQNLSLQGVDVQVFTAQPGYAFDQEKAPEREWMGKVWVERSNFLRGVSRQWAGRAVMSLAFCAHAIAHLMRRENRGDVLFLTSEPPFLQVVGLVMHWLFKTPFVTLIYDLYPDVAIELDVISQHHWLAKLWHRINRQVWLSAEAIIVPCSTMKDRIVAHCPEIADKITVIHNWADATWIEPMPKADNAFAQAHDLLDPFVVLYSGNMGRCHDMETILEAVTALRSEPIEFMFIGGGPKRQALQQQIQAAGLTNCQFLPYQDKALLPLSLTACDLSLVSVAKGMEGLVAPSKFYSALCAGRPVAMICEPHSYLRSLLQDAEFGAAFQNGEGQSLASFIRYLAKDSTKAAEMGRAGRRYVEVYFTPARISQQYFQILYRAVFGSTGLYLASKFATHLLTLQRSPGASPSPVSRIAPTSPRLTHQRLKVLSLRSSQGLKSCPVETSKD